MSNITDILNIELGYELSESYILNFIKPSIINFETICIFVSGSLVEGYGTPYSDIDVYVIINEVNSHSKVTKELVLPNSNVIVELTILPSEKITIILDLLNETHSSLRFLTVYEQSLLHRIYTGIAIYGKKIFADYRCAISPSSLCNQIMYSYSIIAQDMYTDTIGSLIVNDYKTAAFSALHMINYAFDSYLSGMGATLPLQKWRFQKADQILGSNNRIYEKYLLLASRVKISNSEETVYYINSCFKFFQYIQDWIVWLSLNKNIISVEEPSFEFKFNVDDNKIRYNKRKEIYITCAHNKYFIIKEYPRYEIEKSALLIWLMINNSSDVGDLEIKLEKYFNNEHLQLLNKDYLHSCLDYWCYLDLIERV